MRIRVGKWFSCDAGDMGVVERVLVAGKVQSMKGLGDDLEAKVG